MVFYCIIYEKYSRFVVSAAGEKILMSIVYK